MASVNTTKGTLSVRAWVGDFKTLLAFNFSDKKSAKNLAGFTIQCKPQGQTPYYLLNNLRFETPANHAQDASESEFSSINAPYHKFRWLHVPGSFHQGTKPFIGPYTYVVTPRYFDAKQSMLPLDPSLSAEVTVNVGPFSKGNLALGFARGFVQSQAFVHHFGKNALIRPKGKDLIFDTSQTAGANAKGQKFTFADEYEWSGFTARQQIFALVNEVSSDSSLNLKVFAYDLNESDFCSALLNLAGQGRVRIILDNATLHHNAKTPKPEDVFEQMFQQKAKNGSAILRGKFGRYAHDKVLIVSKGQTPIKALAGSTNFSITGIYVNSNHVLVFNDPQVAAEYSKVFEEAWNDKVSQSFQNSPLAAAPFTINFTGLPKGSITFSPHTQPIADGILQGIVTRIGQEKSSGKTIGSVLFAVMQLDDTSSKGDGGSQGSKKPNPVYQALRNLHTKTNIFTYGISDSPGKIFLHSQGKPNGVLVTGKPGTTELPPPFDQVASVTGHQIHHKFVVCGFRGDNPVVYCGSSNLAPGGEHQNGDNLLEIHDADVAVVFAIEAMSLGDHFSFLDRLSKGKKTKKSASTTKRQAAVSAGWFLSTDDKWAKPYFDPKDLYSMDRQLFG